MTEQRIPQDDLLYEYTAKKTMKETFNRFGWALFALLAVWYGLIIAVSAVIVVMEFMGYSLMPFYERYMLIFNELGLAVGIVAAMLVLKPMPKYEIENEKLGFERFLKYLAIGLAIGMAGNLISNTLLTLWNGATGNEAGNEVETLLMGSNYVITFLMVGILAPFLEEFLFRKLLIDHTRQYGELTCILTSGVLFGLFHGNFTQFFYAFGLGALFAYIYFRSGNFFLVFVFHAVFNILSGILPMLVMEYGSDIGLVVYAFVYPALVITGIVFFIRGIQRFKPRKGEIVLPRKTAASAIIFNPGIISAVLLMLAMMVMSLFAE